MKKRKATRILTSFIFLFTLVLTLSFYLVEPMDFINKLGFAVLAVIILLDLVEKASETFLR